MRTKSLLAVGFLLFACGTCCGQTSFQGLTPGTSTRADVERVLGTPLNTNDGFTVNYSPPPA